MLDERVPAGLVALGSLLAWKIGEKVADRLLDWFLPPDHHSHLFVRDEEPDDNPDGE